MTKRKKVLIVVPWLEGGGAQAALAGILQGLEKEDLKLVVLFDGNRNHEPLVRLVGETVFLKQPRTVAGVFRAALSVRREVAAAEIVYSLMRGSHLVLGIASAGLLRDRRFAASFHQLPSSDSSGLRGVLEDVFVKRATRKAALVTSPSRRAVDELIARGFAKPRAAFFEQNKVRMSTSGLSSARPGKTDPLRLLFAGRLSEQKGLDRLPALVEACSVPLRIRVVGSGELRRSLEKRFEGISAPHQLEMLGHTDEIIAHLDWADCIVMPSRSELNPLLVWEAWARGRGTIAWRLDVFEDLKEIGPVWLFDTPTEFAAIVDHVAGSEAVRLEAFDKAQAAFAERPTESLLATFMRGSLPLTTASNDVRANRT